MLTDNAYIEGPSDIVADNVTSLSLDAPVNSLHCLIQPNGSYVPGLYLSTEDSWILISAGEIVF